jgi:hypothetical protein
MDQIIVGHTEDKNYKLVGKLADGTPVYRYDPIPEKRAAVDEAILNEYNSSVEVKDTETQELLAKFHWEELKDQEKVDLKNKIRQGYVDISPITPPRLESKVELIEREETDPTTYLEKFHKDEDKQKKEERRKQRFDEQRAKNREKRKSTPIVPRRDEKKHEEVDHVEQVEGYKSILEKRECKVPDAEPEPEIDEKPPTHSSGSLWDSYNQAKEIGKEVEKKLEDEYDQSVSDYYKKLENFQDKQVKGKPDSDTSEYYEEHESTEGPAEEIPTTSYLQIFEEEQTKEEEHEDRVQRIVEEHQQRLDKARAEQEKTDPLFDYDSPEIQYEDIDTESYKEVMEAVEGEHQAKEDKRKEIKRKAEARIAREINEEELRKRDSAIKYINQLYDLNQQEQEQLKLVEKEIAKKQEQLREVYQVLLEKQSGEDIHDEFEYHNVRVNIYTRTVTVTDKETNNSFAFSYLGTLRTYDIDGYKVQLYSISKDRSTWVNPELENGWYVTHYYNTYDIRDGSMIEKDSFTIVKPDPEIPLEEDEDSYDGAAAKGTATLKWARETSGIILPYIGSSQLTFNVTEECTCAHMGYSSPETYLARGPAGMTIPTSMGSTSGTGQIGLHAHVTGRSDRSITAEYTTVSAVDSDIQNALPWVHYTPTSGVLHWKKGVTGSQHLTGISILEKYESERLGRTFQVKFQNVKADGVAVDESTVFAEGLENPTPITIKPRHHGFFAFTKGGGYSNCSILDNWTDVYPSHALSAVAPDGYALGGARIGVERLSGFSGDVTVRFLVSAGMPPYATSNDYTINGTPPNGLSDATGSGAYNYGYEALDAEVAFVSGGGRIYETDPLSGSIQTLTWMHGESGTKYIDIRHCKVATDVNVQAGYRWYAVYLTFDQSYQMGVSATPGSGYRPNTTRTPTACSVIAQLDHGAQYQNYATTLRGSSAAPFFVAVSGWATGVVSDFSCEDPYSGAGGNGPWRAVQLYDDCTPSSTELIIRDISDIWAGSNVEAIGEVFRVMDTVSSTAEFCVRIEEYLGDDSSAEAHMLQHYPDQNCNACRDDLPEGI